MRERQLTDVIFGNLQVCHDVKQCRPRQMPLTGGVAVCSFETRVMAKQGTRLKQGQCTAGQGLLQLLPLCSRQFTYVAFCYIRPEARV